MNLFDSIEILYSGDKEVWDYVRKGLTSDHIGVIRSFVQNKHAEESRILRDAYSSTSEWFKEGAFKQSRVDDEMHRAMLQIGYN